MSQKPAKPCKGDTVPCVWKPGEESEFHKSVFATPAAPARLPALRETKHDQKHLFTNSFRVASAAVQYET